MPRNYNNLASLLSGRRSSDIPNIDFTAGNYTPAVYQPTLTYTPVQIDTGIIERNLNKEQETIDAINQQKAAMRAAIGNLKLGHEEDKWKEDYINRLLTPINQSAAIGDPFFAKEVATKTAAEAVSSPEVTGRLRYHDAREKWISSLETRAARGEIDDDTLARAKYENPYDYKDTYDNNGNIIGGNDWKAKFEPVRDLNLSQVAAEIKALVTPSTISTSSKGGTSQVYIDSEGKQTTDSSKAAAIFSTITGGGSSSSKTEVTAQQWADAFDAWVRIHPESARQFEQKRQNNIWLYKQNLLRSQDTNLTEEQRAEARANADIQYAQLTDSQGGLLTAENYARSITNPMFNVMQYRKDVTTSEGGSTLLNDQYIKNKTLAQAYGMTIGQAELYGMSSPTEQYAILKDIANSTNNLTNAGKEAMSIFEQSFKSSSYDYTPVWQLKK